MINWFIDKGNELFDNVDKMFVVEIPPIVDRQMVFPFYAAMLEK